MVEKITSNESSISSEITRAEDAERNLKNLIDSKVQTGWAYIDNKVSDEETRATEKESELEDKITSNSNNITTLTTNLTSEISRAKQEESALKTSLDSNTADIATLNTSLTSETSNREEADTALTTSINEEVARATAAEKTNSDNITAEATRATDAEVVLEKMISDEVARATNAETANSTAITTETNRAKDEETSIKSDLTTETDRAIGQEKILQSNISSLETALSTKISANATSISSLDTLTAAHTASIDTLTASINAEIDRATEREDEIANSVTTEASARMTKDADLQTQIDAINLRSDCVDIVATKAALDAYDKTSLTDNDIIKVLSDESSDSKISYYKYSTADSTYTLIGAIGPFSTISETEEKISAEETRAKGVEALLESSITSGDDSTLATAKEYTDSKVITDYVTLSTDQTVSGSKTFSSDIAAPNIRQSTQSPEYSTFNATCGITPRWFSTCGGDDGTFFIIDLSNTAFPFVDMFIGGNNETPTQKWAVVYDESGTLNYALNAVEMELRIHKHRVDQKYADVYITDHRDGKIVNDSVSGGYVVIYSTKNLMFEGYVGTSTDFYSTTKPSWFDASALSEKYNSRFVSKDDFDALVTRVAALESTADKEY